MYSLQIQGFEQFLSRFSDPRLKISQLMICYLVVTVILCFSKHLVFSENFMLLIDLVIPKPR